jgi:hypothetical protein
MCHSRTFTVPFFSTALHRVRPHETGSAAGLLNAVQQLGGTLGVALLGGLCLSSGPAATAIGRGRRRCGHTDAGTFGAPPRAGGSHPRKPDQ